jgi:serine/threonine-protein kinase
VSEGELPPFAVGDVLASKYRVERVLGSGGMGVVVAAQHVALHHKVALKLMLPGAAADSDAVARFLREARSAAQLTSEHVARVLDVGTLATGAPFMVMELLDGSDLEGVLRERGPLPVTEAVDYIRQACDAVAEAHERGIVHRDLKPGNLFLARDARGRTLITRSPSRSTAFAPTCRRRSARW